jgi:hypothetical protein
MQPLSVRLAILAALPVTWLVTFLVVFGAWHYLSKRPVDGAMPANYPIVAMAGGRARIVWGAQLEQFERQHPDYSFLVPIEQATQLRDELAASTRSRQGGVQAEAGAAVPWYAWFEVRDLAAGRQSFRVDASMDDDRENVGWYEATAREIFPRYHRSYFGPGRVILVGIVAAVVAMAAFVSGNIVWEVRARRGAGPN